LNFRQLALVGVAALALGGTTAVAQVGQQGQIAQAQMTPPPPPVPGGTATAAPVPAAPATPVVTMPPQPTGTPSTAPNEGQGPGGRRGGRHGGGSPRSEASPSASDTPEPPQFQTMTGVWEVQLQPLDRSGKTIYSHLYVTQAGDQLTGYWVRNDRQRLDFTGTFDGRLFKLAFTPAAPTPAPTVHKGKGHGKVDPAPSPTATGAFAPATTATAPAQITFTMSGYAENFGDMVGLLTSNMPNDQGTPFTASHRKKERQAIGVQ
jgi:hypothetical protein